MRILHELGQDALYTARISKRRAVLTALAFAALALGIGVVTGVFSVVNALLFRSLPFREAGRLVEIQHPPVAPFSGRSKFYRWRDNSPYCKNIAAYSAREMNLGVAGHSMRVKAAEVSANFLRLLGNEPIFGRGFVANGDVPGQDAVAVIGYGFWQQFLGSDPHVLGRTIHLNGVPVTVIGVMPPGFDYPAKSALWLPTAFDPDKIPKSGVIFYRTIGRLKPGVSMAQARTMFRAEVARLAPHSLDRKAGGFSPIQPRLISLRKELAGPVRPAALILLALVAFVLLIACANVAHLLLSRLAERRRELCIRAALGASRARIIRQLTTESALLIFAATLLGLGVAWWTSRIAASVQPAPLSAENYTILDWRVIAFAAGAATLTAVLFGILPAWFTGRLRASSGLLRTQTVASGRGIRRIHAVLIGIQAAFTVVLLAGALLLTQTFLRLLGTDMGFRTGHVVTLNVSLAGTNYDKRHTALEYYRQALNRLRAMPGVESAAAVSYLPLMSNMYMAMKFRLDPHRQGPPAITISATPGYFRSIGTPILEGRGFTALDRKASQPVAIVSQKFAREMGTGSRVVGRHIWDWRGKRRFTIVGVVKDIRLGGPMNFDMAQVYFPFAQAPLSFATFVARVSGKAKPYLAACRDAFRQIDPHVPVYDVKTLNQWLAIDLARSRFYTAATAFLAGFALLLAIIGIYGTSSYSVVQRTHEIGVRIALGASPVRVRLMLLRQNMFPLLAGLVVGAGGAMALGKSFEHLVSTTPQLGIASYAPASAALAIAAGSAVWVATRRILRINPARALQAE